MGNLGGHRVLGSVLLLLVMTGCTTSPVEPPLPPSGSDAAIDRTVSPTPSTRAYDSAELESALPRAGRRVHGFKIVSQCRLLRAVCEGNEDRGLLYVAGSDEQLNSWEVFVALQSDPPASAVRYSRRACTNRVANRPFRWDDTLVGSYFPGFRGTVARDDWSYAGWTGHICTRRGVSLWSEGRQSDRYVEFDVSLYNGHHILTTQGRTRRETKVLSKEYIDRLST